MLREEMLNMKKWAVVGATINKEKFGYKIWKILKDRGYQVYGVNPNYEEIQGDKLYPSLKDLPEKVDVVDLVVPPKISAQVIEKAKELGIEYIWFQPGTYNDEVIEKAKKLNLKILYDDCVLAVLENM